MIELKNLTKKFGDLYAVDHFNLKVATGEFLGLPGANGAGKTTTISMISTVLLPTEGEILIDGKKLDRRASDIKKKLKLRHPGKRITYIASKEVDASSKSIDRSVVIKR